ncbi:hypothetical protein [Corynebacterium alimapuense]|uniref:Uncharacterized protein n=1 Tax=Corynebacterium alimapuense TaxID=1576874 RepID=A0A3M8KBB0_9CORY|nr:hypothetical protein [Corynebacterium alimapuense]RNE49748.1 hypothetical protein C5L39_02915 [Corynebacterium alimapuense]
MTIIIISSLLILVLFRLQGLLLIAPIVAIAFLVSNKRPDATEITALRASIALSAEDISDVLAEYDQFATAPDADSLADRTLMRPALIDQDCEDPAVESFRHQYATSRRYLSRLEARLSNPALEVSQLESLLSVTDQRALDIESAWLTARQAAKRLGPNY